MGLVAGKSSMSELIKEHAHCSTPLEGACVVIVHGLADIGVRQGPVQNAKLPPP